jgi:uncharacterized protein (TIGR03083 family)
MSSDPRSYITALRGSHERLAALVAPLTPEQLRGPSYASEWTIAQVLSHLGSGAEISMLMFDAHQKGEELDRETFGPVWDRWNAKSPDEQAADGLASDTAHVESLERLTDEQLAAISMPFFGGMVVDAAGLVRLRLGEHALHTWDVAVPLDPVALVAPDAVALLIDSVPQFLAPYVGKAPEQPFAARITITDPAGDFLLTTSDAVAMTPWPGTATEVPAHVRMPAEALLRLAYGRLDPLHTPDSVTGGPAALDTLRAIFPGF